MGEGKQRRRRGVLFVLTCIVTTVVLATSAVFTVLLVRYRTRDVVRLVDSRLQTAAELTQEMLGSDYHDGIVDATSVPAEYFHRIVARNDDFCRRLNLQYLWSVLLVGDRLVFTSATHSNLNDPNSPCATFFETHRDPESFAPALQPGVGLVHSYFNNEWGTGRQILIPRKDAHGRTYILGASVQMAEFKAMVRGTVLTSVGISLAVIGCSFLLTFALARVFTAPIAKLTQAAGRMATGDFDAALAPLRTRELQSLSTSLDQMREGLKGHWAELRESEERLRLALAGADLGAWDWHIPSGAVRFNERWAGMLGYTLDEIEPSVQTWESLLHPDDAAAVMATLTAHLEGKIPSYETEHRLRHKSGGWVWVLGKGAVIERDAQGQPVRACGTHLDITEHRRAEEALRTSEERLRVLAGNLPNAVLYQLVGETTGPRRFTYISDAVCRVNEVSVEAVLADSNVLYSQMLPAYLPGLRAAEAACMGGERTFHYEFQACLPSGTLRWFELSASIHLLPDGRVMSEGVQLDITARKQAEEALRTSEKLLSDALEMAHLGHWEYDVATDRFTFNDHFYKIFHATAEQAGGYTMSSAEYAGRFVHPDDRALVAQEIQYALETPDPQFSRSLEHRMIFADGTTGYTSVRHFVVKDAQGRTVKTYGVNQDITDRRRTEEALRASEERYRRFVETANEGIWAMDRHYKTTFVNARMAQIFGRPPEEIIGQPVEDFMCEEDLPAHRERMRHRQQGQGGSYQQRFRRPDGSEVWTLVCATAAIDAQGAFDGSFAMYTDITERRRAEELLEASEERFRQIVERSNDVFYRQDACTAQFEYMSPKALDILGYTPEEVMTQGFEEQKRMFHPDDLPKLLHFRDELVEADARGEAFIEREFRFLTKSGTYRWLHGNYTLVRDAHNEPHLIVGSLSDITERKQAEETLRLQHELAVVLGQTFELIDSLKACLAVAMRISGMDCGGVYLVDKDTGTLWLAWQEGLSERFAAQVARFERDTTEARLVQEGRILYTDYGDLEVESHAYPEGLHAFALIPIAHNGRVIASLNVASRTRPTVDFTVRPLLESIAAQAGGYIERALLYEALRESEEAHRTLVAGLPDLVMRFDRDGRHLFTSDNFEDLVGIPAAASIGKTHRELGFPEPMCQFWEEAIRRVFDSGVPFETEFSLPGTNGAVLLNWRLIPERSLAGKTLSVLSISRDITAHRRAEENYRTLFREMLDGFALHEIVCDEDGRPKDYRVLAVNPAFERMMQIEAEAIVGRTLLEVSPHDESYVIETYGRVALTGEAAHFEHYFAEWGRHFDVKVFRPAPGQLACIVADITDRAQAEAALRESEHRFSDLVAQSPHSIQIVDTRGQTLLVNRAFETLWGIPSEQLRDYNILEDEQLEATGILPYIRQAFAGEPAYFPPVEYTAKRGAYVGHTRVVQGLAYPVKDKSGAVREITVMHEDITERRRADEALQQVHRRLDEIIEFLPDATFVIDTKGTVIAWSKAMEKMTGVSKAEMLGKGDYEYAISFYGERRPLLIDLALAADAHFETTHYANVYWQDDNLCGEAYVPKIFGGKGALLWGTSSKLRDVFGNVVGAIESMRDITERRRAEEALRESNQLFSLFVQRSPIYAFIKSVTPTESRVLQVSDNFVQMTGIAGEDMKGKTMEELFPPAFAAKITADDWSVVAKGEVLTTDEELDGRNYATIKFPIVLGGKTLLAGYTIDLTERKALEAQLQQAQKMESVGRLAGGVAHDFNNMLAVILGNAELALEQVDAEQPLHASIAEIHKAAQHSADLTRQLLAFARRQTVAPKVLDLNETVAGTLRMLQRLIGEAIQLVWKPKAPLWPIRIDPSQIDQILANLCVNARDAIGNVGQITIETDTQTFDEAYCAGHAGAAPGDYVLLVVSDDGRGMDKETLAHVFEPFFTTKGVGEGTGLGLATVYGAVKQNGGFINAYSEPGTGTTISIYLPRHVGKAESPRTDAAPPPVVRGHETILLVEDEASILRLTTSMLERQGYTVLPASGPGEAIRLAREHAGEIHLLMTDVVMPEMNGRDLAKNLLSLYPYLKRLFMSGYTADVIAHHGILDDGVHFIQKPFTMKNLAAKLREILDA